MKQRLTFAVQRQDHSRIRHCRCEDPSELDTCVSGLLCQRCSPQKAPVLPPAAAAADAAGGAWVCGECGHQVRADFAAALEEKLREDLEDDR